MRKLFALLAALVSLSVGAETFTNPILINPQVQNGRGTGVYFRLPTATSNPASCTVGDTYFKSNATAGSNLQGCTATNTWTAQGGSGTVSSVSVTTANGVSGSVATATTTPAITLTLGAITPSSVSTGAVTSSALTSGRVPFAGTAGLLGDSSDLTYNDTTKRLTVGTGTTTSVGGTIGYGGSTGYGGLWLGPSSNSPTGSNHSILDNGTSTYFNTSNSASNFNFQFGNGPTRLQIPSTAGAGPVIAAGTATTDVAALSVTRTNNNAAVATGVKFAFTDTTSAAGFLPFQVLGGAAAATNLLSVSKSGDIVTGATMTIGTLASDATHTDATVCRDTTTGLLLAGSGTIGICLGTSSARFKTDIEALKAGLPEILALKAITYKLDKDHGDPKKQLYGFTAEDGGKVLPDLMGLDAGGKPNTFDYLGIVPVLVKAMQEQQAQIDKLTQRLASLESAPVAANDPRWVQQGEYHVQERFLERGGQFRTVACTTPVFGATCK